MTCEGVIWLSQADKIIDTDTKLRDEYDFIYQVLRGYEE